MHQLLKKFMASKGEVARGISIMLRHYRFADRALLLKAKIVESNSRLRFMMFCLHLFLPQFEICIKVSVVKKVKLCAPQ